MRVKRLEIQGFKSFKDKTVIHFDHGITGIVGPNGCGKSNIVDAFFWVMGEQSYKHMRGSSSDDLIFNGSAKYSPLGVAEATMVLETDVPDTANAPAGATTQDIPLHLRAKEIAVTRRLYRDGSGEYFINGLPARLKDIQELFMDTGVGAKGYSVIEQGQIGKIVNSKPEDRRLLIEEAAGIAKYKARKKESLRKMEATQANLSRLNDVIQEIERGLSSLERQAQKARQYHKYKAELLEKELTWGRRKSSVLRARLETLKAERDQLEQELVALRAELQTSENSIEVERTAQLTDSKAAEAKQASIQLLADELTRQKSALDLSRKRQGDLAEQLTRLGDEKSQLEAAITDSRALTEQQTQGSAAAAAELEQAQSQLSAAQGAALDASRAAQGARSRVDQAKREHLRAITESSDLTSSVAAQLARAQSAVAQAERILAQITETQARHAQAAEQLAGIRASQAQAQDQLSRLREEKRAAAEQSQAAEASLRTAEKDRENENRSLTQIKSRLQSLEDLVESNAGMADGPKSALEWAKAQGVNLGALAASFNTDAENASVLDTWLDQKFQGLQACGDKAWSSAVGSIATVRDQKQGRIQVWLESAHRAAQNTGASISELEALGFGGIQKLSDLVQTDSDLASDLISGVWVVDQFPAQLSEADLARIAGVRLVSRDGMALDENGILRGGTKDTSGATGLIKRKRQIEELRAQQSEQEQKVTAAEQAHAAAKESLELARARLSTLQSELQAAEIEFAALSRDLAQTERQVRDLDNQLNRERGDLTRAEQESARAESQRVELQARLDQITHAQSGREDEIITLEAELAELEGQARDRDAAFQSLRLQEAQARERAQSLKRELDGTLSVLRDREKRISDIDRILERASQEHAGHSGGDSGLENQIAELTTRLADERAELAAIKDRLEQASGALNGFLESVKIAHKAVDEKSAASTQLAIELERVSGDLSHLVQDLEQKYGPGCLDHVSAVVANDAIQEEMTAPVVTVEMTAEEERLLGEEVERIRERIRRLGEFNPMAVEEFEEAKKRHDHLLSERNDLEQSMANLQDAIDHINATSEERFRKAFQAIADRFERLFPIIFGGGSAKLSLVYPEGSTDILEAGCDILAQPPGKKVSNIGLLSGGEKALTAVSLIFAIFMVKPSPFCVLDEVDAPLDDANIGKFNALLREMSSKSQFIVITHNKKTMELNDALYGVTMEEPGVSKMVSIELT